MQKFTLQERISKTFIGVFACMLLISTLTMSIIAGKVYSEKSYQMCEQLVRVNLQLLNSQITQVQKNQENIAKNEVVKDAVSYYGKSKGQDYGVALQHRRKLDEVFYLFAKTAEVRGAYIIDTSGECLYFYKESPRIRYNMLQEKWYKDLTDSIYMQLSYVSGLHDREYLVNDREGQCVSMVMPIQITEGYQFQPDAYLVCDINMDSILDSSDSEDDMQFAILDNDKEMYSVKPLHLSEKEEKAILESGEEKAYSEIIRRNLFQSSIVVSMKARLFGWHVVGIRQMQEITDISITLLIVLTVSILLAVFLTAVLSGKISRSILLPMNHLIEECNQVAEGDYEVHFEEKKSKEIAFLSDTIESMVHNIVNLSDQVVEEEKKLSEEKLRVLQHQINPHFLNNVLQTIKAMAVEGETEKVSRMSTLLGHILAYSVYEPYENVELKTEIEYLKNYIELQNIRYDGRIFFGIECEKEAERAQIPKLTLQPLVENAIEHAYDGKSRLVIDISAECEDDIVYILIHDNGNGICREKLDALRKQMDTGEVYHRVGSVGIGNVNERLKKKFGEGFGLQMQSKGTGGTTVIIRIPANGEAVK